MIDTSVANISIASESMTGQYIQAVAEVAKLAGELAMSYYGKTLNVDTKQDGSPVTMADRGAEQLAREWIERRFPQDGILGEEFGTIRPEASRRWIIDPIDGTKSFVRSVPLWGTLVAVTEGERVLAGCAYYPVVRELLAAAPGEGCFWNGSRCRVSDIAALPGATLVITDDQFLERPSRRTAWQTIAAQANVVRTWGDCYGYLLVATGRAEVMVDDIISPWDAAAFQPIITEAGGVFTDWSGNPTAFGKDVVATNSALARDVRSILIEP
jgi:histidinol phosphatase-like enzyme (inositol monophosphatase family)